MRRNWSRKWISTIDKYMTSFKMSKSNELPERHGMKWEEREVSYLLEQVKRGILPSVIAKEVKRTTGGIVSRLKEIACDAVKNGTTKENAATMTGLTIDTIEDTMKKRDFAEQLKEERKNNPPPPKQQKIQTFFPKQKEESLLDVAIEIRELLRDISKRLK